MDVQGWNLGSTTRHKPRPQRNVSFCACSGRGVCVHVFYILGVLVLFFVHVFVEPHRTKRYLKLCANESRAVERRQGGRLTFLTYHTIMTVRAVVAATVACLAAAASGSARVQAQVAPPTAFDIYWNGPSSGCHNPPIPLENYTSIRVNEGQAFVGEEIACFYSIGVFPRLTATQNATPCWSKHTSGCSWNPWDNITAVANNGVPQLANLTLHKEKVGTKLRYRSILWMNTGVFRLLVSLRVRAAQARQRHHHYLCDGVAW